ncbi:MAG TPA: ABC transporter substrate-binding protein [Chloroflexota bacterium]|nr:ABC transporter substrate-binding protein [Chloroflexota bacterium]
MPPLRYLIAGLLVALLAACAPSAGAPASGAAPSGAAPAATSAGAAAPPTASAGGAATTASGGAAPGAAAHAPLSPPVAVKFGDLPATSNAGVYIALDRGYFQEEGLDVSLETFDSFERAIPPLATNQLDVAGGGVNAGMFSAMGRGLPLKIVAGISGNGAYSSSALVVRKELIDSGRVKDYPDLKGLRIALLSKSSGLGAEYERLLQKGGFTENDIDLKLLPFPDATVAMSNGAIDAGILTEPFVAQLVRSGVGVRWKGAEEIYPGHQITAMLYGPDFAGRQEPATRFLTAYLRGARDYNALINSSDRTPLYEILAAHTPIKDMSIYPAMSPSNIDPNGTLNVDSLRADQDLWASEGFIEQPADFAKAVDLQYLQAAVQRLGPER